MRGNKKVEKNIYKIPELLAPVGGPEQLRAAVENGADAVYMGGALFNARMNAGNFTREAMKESVEYAHMRGTAVHVTMNTLLLDSELEEAVRQAADMYEAGADAFIIQDLGFAALLKKNFPEMVLHLSTQGTVYNGEGVKKAAQLGFSRVVLAREMSLEEIRSIAADRGTEIEVFVHGALCMSYSGQCQMSRVIGGRSGNRGQCAQPCRLGYEIHRGAEDAPLNGETKVGTGFLLSPKDICTVDHLGELARAGVASLKIEGRMKSPEYVAVATGIYRKYLDDYAEKGTYTVFDQDRLALNQIFNRGAFTPGYLLGNPRRELLSGDLPKHQGVYIGEVISANPGKRTVKAKLAASRDGGPTLFLGDGVEIRNQELSGNIVTYIRENEIGYLTGKILPGDKIYKITDRALMEAARASFEGKSGTQEKGLRKRAVAMKLYVRPGQPVVLTIWDGDQGGSGRRCGVVTQERSEDCAEPALTRPLDLETVEKQLGKTGGTPFRLADLELDLGQEPVSVRLSLLNDLRRKALSRFEETLRTEEKQGRTLEEGRLSKAVASIRSHGEETEKRSAGAPYRLSYYLFHADREMLALAERESRRVSGFGSLPVSRYYLPYELFLDEAFDEPLARLRRAGKETVPFLPAITRGREDVFLRERMEQLTGIAKEHGISVGNLWQIDPFVKAGARVYGDFGLNFYNRADIFLAGELGLSGAVFSNETLSESSAFGGGPFDWAQAALSSQKAGVELEAAAGGWIPLMISAHCPIGDLGKGCRGGSGSSGMENDFFPPHKGVCGRDQFVLKDRKNQFYSILTRKRDCQVLLFRMKGVFASDFADEIRGKGIINLRYYGIDKKIFCSQPST